MKNQNLRIVATVLLSMSSFASIAQSNWTITGNANTTGGTNFLGTTNAQPIDFRTSNVQRMRITSTGLVGVDNI